MTFMEYVKSLQNWALVNLQPLTMGHSIIYIILLFNTYNGF